ncbi:MULTISPECIES: cysteine desulfurase [unclassified Shewanella]|uniref:cysteine desulfurase n=1 Tax=unclassified Shewanella TaxID=196818 RepID=UPI000C82E7D3|nr:MULTISPECIES: cysteine desulfurase [unclassified Shewanella]MDO6678308.1 cysteine desulfurase [Shewanella sp. 4_MG-2023]PMG49001.1 cysteine sulfinate desulfinase [Shewanella sp. 10N.286.52.B9]PMH85737.1 cysteine sulfinate desulfinase [Shewanella sp. 10N.286.48.B5]PMI03266.1 cysteine sulfinate desulfinase [Shewanella sp. 10N.286.48.A6]
MTVPVDTVLINNAFDHQAIRSQFPILDQQLDDNPLCYLDTAATSQKPVSVIEAMTQYYQHDNANVHRAAHQLSARATANYEHVRHQVKQFINASQTEEVIFTHGTTESINMVAAGLSKQLKANDIILVDSAAHHANLVPWQQLAKNTGAVVKPIPLNEHLSIDINAYSALLSLKPKLVAISHVTNALGSVNDVSQLVELAQQVGALTLVDGAQAIAHIDVDVQQINCDFYVFSGHKMYGPTGVGILYGRYAELDKLEPLLTGGEMIKSVSFEATTFGELPNKLEAGTPAISAVIGLGAAISFINGLPKAELLAHEQSLLNYLQNELRNLGDITLIGATPHNIGVVAFNLAQEHHQDVGILLDQQGIAVRCGHHCAMPLMQQLNIKGCCRASIGLYTNKQDIDLFIAALGNVKDLLL